MSKTTQRNSLLLRLTDVFGPWFIRFWIGSLRVRTYAFDTTIIPSPGNSRGAIFAGWHESLLVPAYLYAKCHAYTLVSQSLDGEYIARVVQQLGWRVIRGSSSQGAISALWEAMEKLTENTLADFFITADGPSGPRRIFKEGAVYMASRTGRPLIPVGLAYDRPWRARSWDRFILPRPFSRVCIVFGRPILVPLNINSSTRALYRSHVQELMDSIQEEAENRLELFGLKDSCSINWIGDQLSPMQRLNTHPDQLRNDKLTLIPEKLGINNNPAFASPL